MTGAQSIDPGFWKGKRVFLTGHTGFKGSWLSLWLQRLGAEVHGYALEPPSNPSMFDDCAIGDGMRSEIADVRDADRLQGSLRESQAEVVIHMAAQPLVRASYELSLDTYAINVMGTANLLEAVRRVDTVRAVVVITTDKCYHNKEWVWGYREDDELGGHDPYSNSKACAELVTAAFRDSFFNRARFDEHRVAVATARAGNVVGGGDWAEDRLVPDIIRAVMHEVPVEIRFPDAIRPWQHVLEPLGGYLLLAERLYAGGPEFAEAWNFGPAQEDARPVSWIADRLTSLWGEGASWNRDGGAHVHEANYLKLDSSKARGALGWRPVLDLATTLDWIVEWFRVSHAGGDVSGVTAEQIARYEGLTREEG